jgi:toxin ParE1/3/4
MEVRKIQVVRSEEFYEDVQKAFDYGFDTFGLSAANAFMDELIYRVDCLSFQYELYPECRFIVTKDHRYRNIILGSYLIIYRITSNRIEVLKVISSRMSLSKIKGARNIKI